MLDVSDFLRKKLLKKPRNKRGESILTQEQVITKVRKKPIETTYMLEIVEGFMGCLEKRQQSSPVVM